MNWIHPPRTREVLAKAGMSQQSELTAMELARVQEARRALDANPRLSQHRIYRIIRPRRDDE